MKHTSPVAYLRLHPKRINNFSVVKKRGRGERGERRMPATLKGGQSRHLGAVALKKKFLTRQVSPFPF